MTKQNQTRYKECKDFGMRVAGKIVRSLLTMDLEKPYNSRDTQNERSVYAGNIYSAIREFRKICEQNKANQNLLSGILEVDIGDLEIKTLAISRRISEDEARELIYNSA